MPRQEVIEHHVDEDERTDLQQVETRQADQRLGQEANEKAQHQRDCHRQQGLARGSLVKKTASQPEDQRERNGRHGVIDQLVRHTGPEQKAQHVDRLRQVLFDGPVADVAGHSRGQPWHARKRPPQHHQQRVGHHVAVAVTVQPAGLIPREDRGP